MKLQFWGVWSALSWPLLTVTTSTDEVPVLESMECSFTAITHSNYIHWRSSSSGEYGVALSWPLLTVTTSTDEAPVLGSMEYSFMAITHSNYIHWRSSSSGEYGVLFHGYYSQLLHPLTKLQFRGVWSTLSCPSHTVTTSTDEAPVLGCMEYSFMAITHSYCIHWQSSSSGEYGVLFYGYYSQLLHPLMKLQFWECMEYSFMAITHSYNIHWWSSSSGEYGVLPHGHYSQLLHPLTKLQFWGAWSTPSWPLLTVTASTDEAPVLGSMEYSFMAITHSYYIHWRSSSSGEYGVLFHGYYSQLLHPLMKLQFWGVWSALSWPLLTVHSDSEQQ